jgi:hypothetical protein
MYYGVSSVIWHGWLVMVAVTRSRRQCDWGVVVWFDLIWSELDFSRAALWAQLLSFVKSPDLDM